MDIIEKTKEIGNEIEETLEKGYEKGKEVLSNVSSHLPFTNLAQKKSGDFHVEIDMPGINYPGLILVFIWKIYDK